MVRKGIRFLLENSLFLIFGTIIALTWANTDHEGYEEFTHSLHFWVNDVAMCFFFALATKEIWEAFLPGGTLRDPRAAATPILATLGGIVGPALVYVIGCWALKQQALLQGWAIPCATDIAFSYMVAQFVFGPKHPVIPFLLLLAIADDALGLIILAVFYPAEEMNLPMFGIAVSGAVGSGIVFNKMGIRSFWPYLLIPGTLSWFGFHAGGIHPALALVPIIPTLPHGRSDIGLFAEVEEERHNTLDEFEHWWKNPVELILCAFGLVNAGVVFSSFGPATNLVLAGLLLGKPLGICLFTGGACACGLKLPDGMRARDVVVVSCVAGMGFTVALFVATVAFPSAAETAMLAAAKMGALFSFGAGGIALIAGRLLNIKKVYAEPKILAHPSATTEAS